MRLHLKGYRQKLLFSKLFISFWWGHTINSLHFHQMVERSLYWLCIIWCTNSKLKLNFRYISVWCRWKWNAHIENDASLFKASPNDGCLNITLCRTNATPKIGRKWTTARKCSWRYGSSFMNNVCQMTSSWYLMFYSFQFQNQIQFKTMAVAF